MESLRRQQSQPIHFKQISIHTTFLLTSGSTRFRNDTDLVLGRLLPSYGLNESGSHYHKLQTTNMAISPPRATASTVSVATDIDVASYYGQATTNSIMTRLFASCAEDPKSAVHRAWGLTLILLVVFFIVSIIESKFFAHPLSDLLWDFLTVSLIVEIDFVFGGYVTFPVRFVTNRVF